MKEWTMDMMERAIKTSAQVAIATIGTSVSFGEVDWLMIASTVGLATILSVLSSLASVNFGSDGTASMIDFNEKGDVNNE